MTVPELVARPVDTVQKLYQRAGCPTASDTDWGVPSHFKDAVAAVGVEEIPFLSDQTVERLPHHSLVRFRGMVQDLLNPEYYVGAFQRPNGEWVTTKFSDPEMSELDNLDTCGQPIVWERRPIVCVPLPGLSSWAASGNNTAAPAAVAPAAPSVPQSQDPSQASAAPPPTSRAAKRERSFDADMQLDATTERSGGVGVGGPGLVSSPAVPQLEQEDSMQDTDLAGDQGPAATTGAPVTDAAAAEEALTRPRIRRREDRRSSATGTGAGAPGHPGAAAGTASGCGGGTSADAVPGEAPGGEVAPDSAAAVAESWSAAREIPGSCMVYLYDNAPALVLHEVVEIVGVVSHVPQLAALEYDNQDPQLEHGMAALELTGGAGGAATAELGPGAAPAGAVSSGGERLVLESMRAAHPPTSKVMRLHAILVNRNPPLVPERSRPVAASSVYGEEGIHAAATAGPSAAASPAGPEQQQQQQQQLEQQQQLLDPAAPSVLPRPPVASLRDRALGLVRWALGGDAVAAEYVLMQLLGRVAARGDPAALGQLTINLSNCPTAHPGAASSAGSHAAAHSRAALAAERLGCGPGPLCAALHAAISSLVPLCVALPLTVDSCNSAPWAPQRDPVRERTRPALLQLAPGTVVLLDETLMAPGQLKAEGIVSLQALMAVSRQQELLYDFETFQHPVPVDIPLVVLTQGRSLLRDSVHVRVPLNATQPFPTAEQIVAAVSGAAAPLSTAAGSDGGSAAAVAAQAGADSSSIAPASVNSLAGAAVSSSDLDAVRSYLAAARVQDGYELAEGMSAVLEQYFVDTRRAQAAAGGTQAPTGAAPAPAAAAAAMAGAAGAGGMTAEAFHTKLTLARLLVRSYGENVLTWERWQQLLQLEHTREARLRVVT